MKKLFLFLLFIQFSRVFCADYVVAAEKFEYTKGQKKNSITDATATLVPQTILSSFGNALIRTIYPDEELERKRISLTKERNSLYLQLNAEYKKRDAIIFENLDEKQFQEKLKTFENSIGQIQKKIDDNLALILTLEKESEEKMKQIHKKGTSVQGGIESSEMQKYSSLFRNLFSKEEELVSMEKISVFDKDNGKLYVPSEKVKETGYDSPAFKREIGEKSINALLTGKITNYGAYIHVSVDLWSYPEGKKTGSAAEIGSTQEIEYICSSIARQLVPLLTNSMQLYVNFEIFAENSKNALIYVDDTLYKDVRENVVLNSGIHKIQVILDGYRTASTTCYFEGNQKYNIQVYLEKIDEGELSLRLLKPVPGSVYANGISMRTDTDDVTKIRINGQDILGEFITEDGSVDFFYIENKNLSLNPNYYINPMSIDVSEYIETRRKYMYGAYSAFMISLIPTFFTNGNRINSDNFRKYGGSPAAANAWNIAWITTTGVSIACGGFWIYELVRYLLAANKVLPQQAKIDNRTHEEIQAALSYKTVDNSQDKNDEDASEDSDDDKKEIIP